MPSQNLPEDHLVTFRHLYPSLDEEELKEAVENFDRYLELAIRIYERLERDPEALAAFRALTRQRSDP